MDSTPLLRQLLPLITCVHQITHGTYCCSPLADLLLFFLVLDAAVGMNFPAVAGCQRCWMITMCTSSGACHLQLIWQRLLHAAPLVLEMMAPSASCR